MAVRKLHYSCRVVLGNVIIASTVVPLVMALSNKFLLSVTAELGISRSAFTLAGTLLHGLGIFLSPLVSRQLAGGNLRRIQCRSILGFAAAFASYSLATRAWHLYLSAIFLGVFYLYSAMIPISITITNWFEEKRGLAMSIAMAGIGAGGFFWSPVVSLLLQSWGWRMTYRIMALVVLLTALPAAAFLMRKSPEDCHMQPYGAGTRPRKEGKGEERGDGGGVALGNLCFFLLCLGMLLNGLISSGALGQLPPAIEELHGPAVQAAVVSAYSLAGVFAKLLHGWISDRFGLVPSLWLGFGAFGLAFVWMLSGPNMGMLWSMALFYGLGSAMGTVAPPLMVSALYGPARYAGIYGTTNSIMQVGLSFGSLLVAGVYDAVGSYRPAWILLAVLSFFTLFLWLYAGRGSPSGRKGHA